MKKKVVLSAGHNISDPGAIGPFDKHITESNIVMAITPKAAAILRLHSIDVLVVPDEIGLTETIKWINERAKTPGGTIGIDLAVELHVNSGGGTGVEGWYYEKSDDSKKFAQFIIDAIMAETGLPVRGTKDETTVGRGWTKLGFIHDTIPLACLVECGFIDNQFDFDILKSPEGQFKVAKGVARGILSYMGEDWKPELLEPTKTVASIPIPLSSEQPPRGKEAILHDIRDLQTINTTINQVLAKLEKDINEL